MRRLAAVLHTRNDGLRLGRCLETLYPCDEILIVDNGSTDQTLRIAREYGAKIFEGIDRADYRWGSAVDAEWLLCLDPCESLTEGLAASLFEWKSLHADRMEPPAFSVFLREETDQGWVDNPEAQTRLVPRNWQRWKDYRPLPEQASIVLSGEVLRFAFP